jgi:hypothetical protein
MGMMMLRVTKTMMSESMAATKSTSDCMTVRRQGEAKRRLLIISIDDHDALSWARRWHNMAFSRKEEAVYHERRGRVNYRYLDEK